MWNLMLSLVDSVRINQLVSQRITWCRKIPHIFGDRKFRRVVSVRTKEKPRRNTGDFSLDRAVVHKHSGYQTGKIKVSSRVLGIKLV